MFCFSCFSMYFSNGFKGFISGWFLERLKNRPNLDPRILYLSPKYFKQDKNKYGNILGTYYFHIWEYDFLICFEGLCAYLFEVCLCSLFVRCSFFVGMWKTMNIGNLKFDNLKGWNLEIDDSKNWKLKIWKLQIWKCSSKGAPRTPPHSDSHPCTRPPSCGGKT